MPIYPYSFQLPPLNVQDIPNDGVAGEFLGISAGGVLDWLPVAGGGGGGDLLAANNLSELTPTAGTARTNLGLGTTDTPTFKNLVIATGSIATSAPVTISQTWNGTGSTVFKALVVDATTPGTTSSSSSLLLDLQVDGTSLFRVAKNGYLGIISAPNASYLVNAGGPIGAAQYACTSASGGFYWDAANSSGLFRDGNNAVALRNSTAAQTFNVYGTSSSSNTVYERMFAKYNASDLAFEIGTQQAGATARPLLLSANGSKRIILEATGSNDTQIYAAGNTARNILALRSLDTSGRFQFYINSSGKSELYVGTGSLISELGSSYFNGGNVGIGTTAPLANLQIGNQVTLQNIVGLQAMFGWNMYYDGSSWKYITNGRAAAIRMNGGASSSGDITFHTAALGLNGGIISDTDASGMKMIIQNTGNVGIGTTAPSSKLEVVGDALVTGKVAIGANVFLERDGDNLLALRNSTAAQGLRVYNTYTDASNYERGVISWESNELNIRSEKGGSGQSRSIIINAALGIKFYVSNSTIGWQYTSAGHLLYNSDNSQDIGANNANRPRNVFVAQTVKANAFQLNGQSHVYSTVNGDIGLYDNALTNFNLLQFGGTSASYPAIKRSSTTLQARLANDSAFAPIQGKLTTDTAYTNTVVAATTGYITIYDSTGTAYRVPCVV